MKHSYPKNIILVAVIITLLVKPIHSFAIWGVGDETQDPALIAVDSNTTAQATLQTIDQYFGYLKTFGLDGLAYSLAQKASQKLVSSVLNAVNGGASANKPPNYVANYASYFASLTGKTTTNYYNSLQYSKNPFAAGIAQGIANTNSGYAPSGLDSFNLDTTLTNGTSWKSAATNLSSAGLQGFDFYNGLAFPQNTPLGSNLIAQQQLGQNLATAQSIAKIQLTSTGYKPQTLENSASGIFSSIGSKYGVNTNALINGIKTSTAKNNTGGGSLNPTTPDAPTVDNTQSNQQSSTVTDNTSNSGQTITLGQGTSDFNSSGIGTDALNNNSSTTGTGADASTGNGSDTTNLTGGQTLDLNGGTSSLSFDTSNVGSNSLNPNVESYSGVNDVGANIATPSSTTSETVNKSTQEAQTRLQNSDQFFKLIFSTLTQLVTGLINKGISSLRSDAGQSSPYQYGSPSSLSGNPNGQKGSWLAGPQTIIDFRNDLGVANQKTALDVQYNQNILDLLKAPVTGSILTSAQIAAHAPASQGTTDVLQKLEACIPGPDTGWETRLQQYTDDKLKATQNRGSQDGVKGTSNSKAYRVVEQQVKLAIQEEEQRIDNPFLNMPAASELRLTAENFYANTKKFQGIFTTLLLKRQIASQLLTLVAQAKAFMPSLVLFDDQWQKLTTAQKNTLYASLATGIKTDFANDYTTTTVDSSGNAVTSLIPLPTDDPTTTIDEYDSAMEKRVLDEEWHIWETDTTHITEAQRQKLYSQFASIQNNITDAQSLQATQTLMNSIQQQNTDLADALHDCLVIKNATQNYQQYTTDAAWDPVKQSLYSVNIKSAFTPDTSIIAVANGTSGIDFSKEGDITLPLNIGDNGDVPGNNNDFAAYTFPNTPLLPLPLYMSSLPNANLITTATTNAATALFGGYDRSDDAASTLYLKWVDASIINVLQVQPTVPLTNDPVRGAQIGNSDPMGAFFKEDSDGTLFCRLPAYTLVYWLPGKPDQLTGLPIGCFSGTISGFSSDHGTDTNVQPTNPNWYKTNRAQIYYNFTTS